MGAKVYDDGMALIGFKAYLTREAHRKLRIRAAQYDTTMSLFVQKLILESSPPAGQEDEDNANEPVSEAS